MAKLEWGHRESMKNQPVTPREVIVMVAALACILIQSYWSEYEMDTMREMYRGLESDYHLTQESCDEQMDYLTESCQALEQDFVSLQELHTQSRSWGALAEPQDCVRQTILLNAEAWPASPEAERAFLQAENNWLRRKRYECLLELDLQNHLCGNDDAGQ